MSDSKNSENSAQTAGAETKPDFRAETANGTMGSQANGESLTETQLLTQQLEKHKNDFLYLRAEFENYKKHAIKERADLLKFGSERLAKDLLSVIDNFERALSAPTTPENLTSFRQGVDMIAGELKTLLQKHNITEIPCEGQPFNPSFHEALTSESSTTVPAGSVLRVFQKAYRYHDKLIRPAQVIVAK